MELLQSLNAVTIIGSSNSHPRPFREECTTKCFFSVGHIIRMLRGHGERSVRLAGVGIGLASAQQINTNIRIVGKVIIEKYFMLDKLR